MPGFEEALQKVWTCSELVTDPFTRLDAMLRNTTKELQSWSQRNVGQIKLQLLVAKTIVHWFDKAQEERQLTLEEYRLRKELKIKSLGLSSLERTMI